MVTGQQAPVSVIIPCYRCGDTIGRAMASVAAQTWRPVEVILIEDCSGDETLQRIHALKQQYPNGWVQVIELPENAGPGTARNVGWEQATQPYIAFLDADDAWHPQKIEVQYRWMGAHPEVALTGHACRVVDEACFELYNHQFRPNEIAFRYVSSLNLLFSNRFPTRSVMLKRCLPYRFLRGKRHSEDFLLWCDISLGGFPCYRSDTSMAFLYKAEFGEAGLSGDLWRMQKGQMDTYRRLKKSGRISGLFQFFLLLWSLARYARRVCIMILRRTLLLMSAFTRWVRASLRF